MNFRTLAITGVIAFLLGFMVVASVARADSTTYYLTDVNWSGLPLTASMDDRFQSHQVWGADQVVTITGTSVVGHACVFNNTGGYDESQMISQCGDGLMMLWTNGYGSAGSGVTRWLFVQVSGSNVIIVPPNPFTNTTGTSTIDWNKLSFNYVYSSTSQSIATSSGLWDSLSVASSTQNCSDGNLFTSALCTVGGYFFIPNTAILDQVVGLPDQASGKFPFSWFTATVHSFSTLSASSTGNMGLLVIDLSAMDPASSTAFGPILPHNFSFLSTTTLTKFIPMSTINLWLFMESSALWIIFLYHQYWMIRNKWLHH